MFPEGLLEEELGVLVKPVPHLVDLLFGQQPRVVDVDGPTPSYTAHVGQAIED